MRINFVDVIVEGSLQNTYIKNEKAGFEFDIRLSYYRGLFLSCVDSFNLQLNGKEVPNKDITFSINDKEFYVDQLSSLSSEFWKLLEPAKIRVFFPGGLEKGEHDIKLDFFFRVPYLPIPGGPSQHSYVPMDSSGQKILELSGEGE